MVVTHSEAHTLLVEDFDKVNKLAKKDALYTKIEWDIAKNLKVDVNELIDMFSPEFYKELWSIFRK